MKKFLLISLIGVITMTLMTSCKTKTIIPMAMNTVNAVGLEEMNLVRDDYQILNTVTADAEVIFRENNNNMYLKDANGDFSITLKRGKMFGQWYFKKFTGIARFGFLKNDYDAKDVDYSIYLQPGTVARNMAIYRIINASKISGADGVIEPVVSTNIEQRGRDIVFKTTVSAKLIKLKTDKK